jgi:hypothetical protein
MTLKTSEFNSIVLPALTGGMFLGAAVGFEPIHQHFSHDRRHDEPEYGIRYDPFDAGYVKRHGRRGRSDLIPELPNAIRRRVLISSRS